MDGLLSARTPPSDDWPAARRRLAFCRNARKVRGANPHVRDDTPRTGPRQELTVGCRKRKFLVGRASTLLGKGGIWELGRRGHAAADGPQSPVETHGLAAWARCRADKPSSPGGGESGTPKAGPAHLPSPLSGCLLRRVAPDHRGTSSAPAIRGSRRRRTSAANTPPRTQPGRHGRSRRRRVARSRAYAGQSASGRRQGSRDDRPVRGAGSHQAPN